MVGAQMGMSLLSTGMVAASEVSVVASAAPAAATGAAGAAVAASGGNASAAPGPAGGNMDLTVLNLAIVLESLESSFYRACLRRPSMLVLCEANRPCLSLSPPQKPP